MNSPWAHTYPYIHRSIIHRVLRVSARMCAHSVCYAARCCPIRQCVARSAGNHCCCRCCKPYTYRYYCIVFTSSENAFGTWSPTLLLRMIAIRYGYIVREGMSERVSVVWCVCCSLGIDNYCACGYNFIRVGSVGRQMSCPCDRSVNSPLPGGKVGRT